MSDDQKIPQRECEYCGRKYEQESSDATDQERWCSKFCDEALLHAPHTNQITRPALVRAYSQLAMLERDVLTAYLNSNDSAQATELRAVVSLAVELRSRIARLLPGGK